MNKDERAFVETVWDFYHQEGRHDLPWRLTADPYAILVSELMLQQTQVERVVPKYQLFLEQFPDVTALAAAQLGDVLRLWQGLGYNRRAKFLWQAAQAVESEHAGVFPDTEPALRSLPGVGPYTAGAIMAFAYNKPVPLIETNVRRVFLHHLFPNIGSVTDTEILQLVEKTLPQENPRQWYAALMDYGTHLKKEHGNMNVRSKHYSKQSKFEGSDRQIRGAVIRTLSQPTSLTLGLITKALSMFDGERVKDQLEALVAEGMVMKIGKKYQLS